MTTQRNGNSRDDKSFKNTKRSTSSRFEKKSDEPRERKFSNSNPTEKSFSNKFSDKKDQKFSKSDRSDKPFKKSFDGSNSSDRPYNKRPFIKSDDSNRSSDRPYTKSDDSSRSSDRPYNKRPFSKSNDSRNTSDRPYNKKLYAKSDEGSRSSDRPYTKSYDKPFTKSDDGSRSSDRPYTKRPFNKSDDSRGASDRPYTKSYDNNNASDRPYKKSFNKSDDSSRSSDRPYTKSYDNKSASDRPYKKSFNKSDDSRGASDRPFTKSYDNNNANDRPYKKSFSKSDDKGNFGKPYKKTYSKFEDERSDSGKTYVKRGRKDKDDFPRIETGLIRLNRYISNAGICSRRKADELIQAGVVSVNGEVVSELGHKVDPAKDQIKYNGELLKREKKVYVLLNKPKDYITTTEDPQERKTVMHLVEKASRERIYPVGRLDRNTTGLILMTNDGDLADKLSHPKHRVTKIYQVELNRNLSQGDLNKIEFGVELEDGLIKPDSISYVTGGSKNEVGIQIHSGKNRIVRRIFEHLGYDVVKLDRVVYANLTKKDLTRGKWRYLEEHELIQLKHLL